MNRKITDVLRIYIVPIPVTDHIYRHPFPFLIFYLLRYRPDFFFLFYIETVKPIHFLPIHLLNPFSLVGKEDPSATYILFVYSLVSYQILPARIPNKFGNRWNVLLLSLMEWRQSLSFILFHNKPLSMYLLEQTKENYAESQFEDGVMSQRSFLEIGVLSGVFIVLIQEKRNSALKQKIGNNQALRNCSKGFLSRRWCSALRLQFLRIVLAKVKVKEKKRIICDKTTVDE